LLDGALAAQPGTSMPSAWPGGLILPLAGAGFGALGGALLVLVFAALRAVALGSGLASGTGRASRMAALALAAPVVIYDSLAMFGGPRASRIPGRPLLSLVVAAAGLGLVWLVAGLTHDLIEGTDGGRRPRRQPLLGALLGAGAVAGIYAINRLVLPHLYPWFHDGLSFALLVSAVLGARLCMAGRGVVQPPRRTVAVALAVGFLFSTAGLLLIGRNHGRLFAAHEKTQLIGHVLRLSPVRPRRSVLPASGVAGAGNDVALPEGPRRRDADVLLITVDALRPDHVGAYGGQRATTPNIDALARRGVRFERAYAQAPHTSFSITSMLTGRYYPTLARLDPGASQDSVAFHLRRYGWKTAAFYPPAVFYVEADKLRAFEASHFEFEYFKVEYLDAHARLSQIAEFFEQERPGRVFLWIHFFEPHEPYERWADHDFGVRDRDRYDSEIAYTDAAVGRLLKYFEQHRPGTVVILTADHGEAFGEHQAYYHGSSLYDEQIRVPLIIAVPGSPAQVVAGPVELVDIAPTILGLLDIPVPLRMRGTDLGPWLRSPPAPAARLGRAFAEFEDTRMVAAAEDKLICDTKKGFCEYYDLRADPGEQRSLVDQNPVRVGFLQAELEAWFADQTRFALSSRRIDGDLFTLERARLGDPTVVDQVAALLGPDQPPAVREEAARLLASTLPVRARTRSQLEASLSAPESGVRDWATLALARSGDPAARARLLPIVSGGGSSPLRLQAARILADLGDRAAVPALAEELPRCTEAAVCRPVVQALGRLRDRRATAPLLAHLAGVVDRRDTVVALGEIADPAAVPALIERLALDEYVTVRAAAAEALGKIREPAGQAARRALAEALTREQEGVVLAAARAALERVSGNRPSLPRSSANKAHSPRPGQRR
jgi:arylsulfatase A-like enzyme/HEAT repeat protein